MDDSESNDANSSFSPALTAWRALGAATTVILVLALLAWALNKALSSRVAVLPQHVFAGAHFEIYSTDVRKECFFTILVVVAWSGILMLGILPSDVVDHPILTAVPVELFALSYLVRMEHATVPGQKLTYMAFLSMWSAIGSTLFIDEIMGRYHVSLFFTIIMTAFAIAFHGVQLPSIGVNEGSKAHIPAARTLFYIQLAAITVLFIMFVSGSLQMDVWEKLHVMHADLREVNRTIHAELRSFNSTVHSELQGIHSELQEVHSELQGVHSELKGLHLDIKTIIAMFRRKDVDPLAV